MENIKINIKNEDIKVNMKLTENPDKKAKAIITLTLGILKIKGFRILPSKYLNSRGEYLWIAVPSYKSAIGKYHGMFFCEDKEIWNKMEEKIWDKYYKRSTENTPKMDRPIADDEIPF